MSEHNFNSFKNLEIPDSWVKGALDVPPEIDEKKPVPFPKILTVAACLTLVVAVSICVFAFYNNSKSIGTTKNEPTGETNKSSAVTPDLYPAKSDLIEMTEDHTQNDNVNENEPTTANNICVGEFSADLVVGEGNIYCVLYDYKTGELMGDENLFASVHLAEIEDLGDGTVKATYAPVDKGVVKKSGEYWYVFYNELAMSPVQNYIYIYIR